MLKKPQTSVLVQGVVELVQGRGNADPLHQHPALTLDLDVLGPLQETTQVPLGGNIVANSEVPLLGLEDGEISVLLGDLLFGSLTLGSSLTLGGGLLGGGLLGGGFLGRLKKARNEKKKRKKRKKRKTEQQQ